MELFFIYIYILCFQQLYSEAATAAMMIEDGFFWELEWIFFEVSWVNTHGLPECIIGRKPQERRINFLPLEWECRILLI